MPEKVALIGSGNWGSAIATKMGINAAKCADFEDTVCTHTCPRPRRCSNGEASQNALASWWGDLAVLLRAG